MAQAKDQLATMVANLEEKSGRSIGEWIATVKASGLEKHGEVLKNLKGEHGLTHGYANLVAQLSREDSAVNRDEADLIATQYAGPKAHLRPVYDRVLEVVQGFGDGFEAAPKKSYVSLRHRKQFGLVQPSTKTRVDLGINLKGREPEGRLEASGSFNAMVSHRVRLESPGDVDEEVAAWLKEAFDAAG